MIAFAIVFALLGAICAAIAVSPTPETSADHAAWVQGIGSVVAIGAATILAAFEIDEARKVRAIEAKRVKRAAIKTSQWSLSYLAAAVELADKATKAREWYPGVAESLKADAAGAGAMLKSVPLVELGDDDIANAVLNFIQVAHALEVLLGQVDRAGTDTSGIPDQKFGPLQSALAEARGRFHLAVGRAG